MVEYEKGLDAADKIAKDGLWSSDQLASLGSTDGRAGGRCGGDDDGEFRRLRDSPDGGGVDGILCLGPGGSTLGKVLAGSQSS